MLLSSQYLFVSQLLTRPFVPPIPNRFTHIFYSHFLLTFVLTFFCFYSNVTLTSISVQAAHTSVCSPVISPIPNFFTHNPIFLLTFHFLLAFHFLAPIRMLLSSQFSFSFNFSLFWVVPLFAQLMFNTCQYTAIYMSIASCCFVSTFLGGVGCPMLVESSSYCAILHLCSLLLSFLQVDFFGVTTIHVLSLHIVIVVRASTATVVRLVRASTATPWIRNHKQY